MIECLLKRAGAFEATALRHLACPETYPGLIPIDSSRVVLRLFRFEALGVYTVWMTSRSKSDCVLRRVLWDRPKELPNIGSPEMYGTDAALRTEQLEALLESLGRVSLPPIAPVSQVGIDGVNHGIAVGEPWPSVS